MKNTLFLRPARLALALVALFSLSLRASFAQAVGFTGTYAQTFDGLSTVLNGTNATAGDGPFSLSDLSWAVVPFSTTGMEGWQILDTVAGGTVASINYGDGSGTSAAAQSYGSTGSTDRALGALAGASRIMAFGVVLRNDSGATITAVTISFTGEQWRLGRSASGADTLAFGYKTGLGSDISGALTSVPALDFVTPTITGTVGAIDGNAAANRTALTASFNVAWNAGEYLVLRWTDANEVGNDHGVAIDDFSITAAGVASAPVIVTLPQNQTVTEGGTATFTVVASGSAPLAYQWSRNSVPISGATGDTLVLTNVQAGAAGEYTVQVSNSQGDATATASLTVNPVPTLAVPTAAAASAVTSSGFMANWAASAGATGYRLDVSTSSSFGSFVTGFQNFDAGSGVSAPVSGLAAGTTYYYRVRAYDGTTTSDSSATITVTTSPAAQEVAYAGGVYAQTFDGLSTVLNGTNATAGDGPFSLSDLSWAVVPFSTTGMEGWQILDTVAGGTVASINYGDGSGTSAAAQSYGSTGSTDRALGALAGASRIMAFGVVLRNDSGATISTVTVSFTGEQWRLGRSDSTADTLSFGYKTGAGKDISGTFTDVPTLSFVTPTNTGTVGAIDGNAAANRTARTASFNVAWNAGEYLVLRWTDANEVGSDHGVAIDDFSIAAGGSAAPVIVTPPQSQTVTAGGTATFTVVAAGAAPLAYQWSRNGVPISGATGDALVLTDVQAGAAGDYLVKVSNGQGDATATASLTVNPASALAAPAAKAATGLTSSGFLANWAASAGATGYRLDVSTSSSFSSFVTDYQNVDAGTALSLPVSGLAAGVTYYYRVRAYDGTTTSGHSATISVTTEPPAEEVSYTGGTYSQTFDGLSTVVNGTNATAGDGPFSLSNISWAAVPFVTTGMEGWQILDTLADGTVAGINYGDGSGTSAAAQSYGVTGSTDRALGVLAGASRIMAFGVVLRNDTGATITAVTVGFTGEQWRLGRSGDGPDTLAFGYKTGAGKDIAGTFTGLAALDFVTPVTTGTVGALDGNATANRKALSASITVDWKAGDYLVLRWSDANEIGNDHGLAVDDFSIVAPGVSLVPKIITAPQDQTVVAGDTAGFIVVASGGAPLTYQWSKDGVAIPGATGATLTWSDAQAGDAGTYTVKVSNSHGSVSAAASLTVEPAVPPVITTAPVSQSIFEGDDARFTVAAGGTAPLTYQWKKTGENLGDDGRFSGVSTGTLAITAARLADAAAYTVVVGNRAGTATSPAATLAVSAAPTPAAPLAGPASDVTNSGFTLNWNRALHATGYRFDVSTSSTFGDFVGGYENTDAGIGLSVPVTGLADGATYYYRVRAYNSTGTSADSATITVQTIANEAPAITSPAATTFTIGLPCTFTVTATGVPTPAFSATGLPSWAVLEAATGLLHGTAPVGTSGVQFAMTIRAENGVPPAATQSFKLNVQAVPAAVTPSLSITTLAGKAGTAGLIDGTGLAALFNAPLGVAIDTTGDVYVADSDNHTIRRITSTGVVTTLAGKAGVAGHADGTGTAATFDTPSGLVLDGSGNLYVADTLSHTIRRIVVATGVVTTFAGQAGEAGATDGAGLAARFSGPQGLAFAATGDGDILHVADTNNHTIRKVVLASGVVTTLAGQAGEAGHADATGLAARFSFPSGLAVGAGGTLFVTDTANNTIRKVSAAGAVTTLAGAAGSTGAADGSGAAARFNEPSALAADAAGATLYVLDTDNHTIRQVVVATGDVTTLAGSAGSAGTANGAGGVARFNFPAGIAWSSTGLVVADTASHTLRRGQFPAVPAITSQPQSRSVTPGNTAQFTVVATGWPAPAYQWHFNGAAIPDATTASLSVPDAQAANGGSYTVVVSNAVGSVTSDAAVLTVQDPGEPASRGGGGAPSLWFVLALVIALAARRAAGRAAADSSRADR